MLLITVTYLLSNRALPGNSIY